MHSLEEIRAEYDRLDRLCGVDTSGIEIRVSRRGLRRLGSFRYPLDGGSTGLRININPALFSEEEQFWDTIRHEYAHALVWLREPSRRHGHDKVWKAACRELGYSPERLAAGTEKGQAELMRRAKYRVHCKGCGRDNYYLREGKVIKILKQGGGVMLRCSFCGKSSFELYIREDAYS